MYAMNFFQGVTVGDDNVRTIIDALKKLESMGYNRIIYVAGSDRVESFNELLNKHNGIDYNFDSINILVVYGAMIKSHKVQYEHSHEEPDTMIPNQVLD